MTFKKNVLPTDYNCEVVGNQLPVEMFREDIDALHCLNNAKLFCFKNEKGLAKQRKLFFKFLNTILRLISTLINLSDLVGQTIIFFYN